MSIEEGVGRGEDSDGPHASPSLRGDVHRHVLETGEAVMTALSEVPGERQWKQLDTTAGTGTQA